MPLSVAVGVGIGASQILSTFDFPLSLVGAGLSFFGRPDAVTTSSGKVTALANQAGGSVPSAVQGGGSTLRPSLVSSWRNGAPAMLFSGGQRLQIGDPIMGSGDWTIWAVYEATSLSGTRAIFGLGSAGGVSLTLNDSSGGKRNAFLRSVGVVNDGTAVSAPEAVILSRVAGVLHLYVNGVEQSLDAPAVVPASATGNSVIGAFIDSGTFHFAGNVGEVGALGARALTLPERTALNTYTTARYAL